jgi:hypothetical protein
MGGQQNDYGDPLGYIPGDGTNTEPSGPPYAPGAAQTLTQIPAQGGPIPVENEIQKPNVQP